jgi:hypothetical protein
MSYVKPVFKCSEMFKENFKNSQCLLTISVGQEVHEGEKFSTTIDLVNDSFGSCVILIDDSLQRHTMALSRKENADFFYAISVREGDMWLERNEKYYSQLKIPTNIIRWDRWLKHQRYSSQLNTLKLLIENDFSYKEAFDKTIEEFLKRYLQRLEKKSHFNEEQAYALCFDYLLEECTALCLWAELNCQFEVYPGKRNLAMNETHKRFIFPTYPSLLHPVTIKFKNRKQFKPQHFQVFSSKEEDTVG